MKNQITKQWALVLVIILSCFNLRAQTKDEIQLVQSIWGMEKSDIVMQYMKFSDSESVKFTPIYDAYTSEYQKYGAERIQILGDYAQNYSALTNEKADELIQKLLKNNASIDKLQLKYYNKIKKEISAIRAAQFMQLELYMQTMIRAEVQSDIPMIGELEKSEKS